MNGSNASTTPRLKNETVEAGCDLQEYEAINEE